MKLYPFCDPYVWENSKVLLVTGLFVKQHKHGRCASEYVNNMILVFILAFTVGAILSVFLHSSLPIAVLLGVAFLYSVPSVWTLLQIKSESEGFTDAAVPESSGCSSQLYALKECYKNRDLDYAECQRFNESQKCEEKRDENSVKCEPLKGALDSCLTRQKETPFTEVYDVIGSNAAPPTLTLPTARNPFMNVLIDEIKYNPTRPMAASVMDSSVKVSLDDFFRTEFTSDPTDVFGRSQSQRQFVSMPSTSIPSDRGSFQDWLYKIDGKTCKEGGREACLPGTDGGAVTWLNVTPESTN
jgi:hypothetical protein